MPIQVQCQCGQSLQAPDNLAGRAVRCPKCSQPLNIPGSAAPAAAAPQANACPSCSATLPPNAVVCVQCGVDLRGGKKIRSFAKKPSSTPADDAQQAKSVADELLAKAEKELEGKPLKSDDGFGDAAGNWGLTLGAAALFVLVIGVLVALFNLREGPRTNYDPDDTRSVAEKLTDIKRFVVFPVLLASVSVAVMAGVVMCMSGWIAIARRAGRGGGNQGAILMLGGPPYAAIYGLMNPKHNKNWAIVCIAGMALIALAIIVFAIAAASGALG